MKLTEHGIPRRNRTDLDTPVEKKIRDAIHAVETAGCHPLLTTAMMLIQEAKDKVSDFVELEMEDE